MYNSKVDTLFMILLILFIAAILVWGITYGIIDAKTQVDCRRLGWANHDVTYLTFESYCIREENEYEITVPLDELKNGEINNEENQ